MVGADAGESAAVTPDRRRSERGGAAERGTGPLQTFTLFVMSLAQRLYELLVTAVAGASHVSTGGRADPPRPDAQQASRSRVSTA